MSHVYESVEMVVSLLSGFGLMLLSVGVSLEGVRELAGVGVSLESVRELVGVGEESVGEGEEYFVDFGE